MVNWIVFIQITPARRDFSALSTKHACTILLSSKKIKFFNCFWRKRLAILGTKKIPNFRTKRAISFMLRGGYIILDCILTRPNTVGSKCRARH